jgi:hypothetical protein
VLTDADKLSAGNLWVSVEEGHVTLAGTVKDEASAERAAQLVRELPEVKDVANLLGNLAAQQETTLPLPEPCAATTSQQRLYEQRSAMTNEGGPPPR